MCIDAAQKADGAAKREATAKLSQTTLDLEKAKRQLASAEAAAAEALRSIDKEKLKADAKTAKVCRLVVSCQCPLLFCSRKLRRSPSCLPSLLVARSMLLIN